MTKNHMPAQGGTGRRVTIELVNPGVLERAWQGDKTSRAVITAAAEDGIDQWNWINNGRPAIADGTSMAALPHQQASAVIRREARSLMNAQSPDIWIHHLISLNRLGANDRLFVLARQDGWDANSITNLIPLPATLQAQATMAAATGVVLPLHYGPHPEYDLAVQTQIQTHLRSFNQMPTPMEARGILETVAITQRLAISAGAYNPVVK